MGNCYFPVLIFSRKRIQDIETSYSENWLKPGTTIKGVGGYEELYYSERDVLLALKHPNIVKLHGYDDEILSLWVEDGTCILDSEEDLIPTFDTDKCMKDILSAIEYMRAKGYVHGLIKEENIVFSEGVYKLNNFELALSKEDFEEGGYTEHDDLFAFQKFLRRMPQTENSKKYLSGS